MKWKRIAGYEDYEISDTGLVRSLKRGGTRVLIPGRDRDGYLYVRLCKDGKAKHMSIHRLVASAFVPNPMNFPTVNHKDENKRNNAVSNLEWLSLADNNRYSIDKSVLQLDRRGNVVNRFPSMTEAARQTGVAVSGISRACSGRLKTAGGYGWQFA